MRLVFIVAASLLAKNTAASAVVNHQEDTAPGTCIPAGLKFQNDKRNSFKFTEWLLAKEENTKKSRMNGKTFTYDENKKKWYDTEKEFYMNKNATHFYDADDKPVATKLSAMQAPLSVPLGSPSRTKGNPHRIGEEKYHWHLYLGDGSDGSTTVVVKIKQDDTPVAPSQRRDPVPATEASPQRKVPAGLKCDGNSFVFTKWLQVNTEKPDEWTMRGRKFAYDETRKENRRWCDAEGEFYMNEDATHFYNRAGKTVAVKRSATIVKGSKKLEPGSPAQEDHWLLHRGDNGDASMTDKVTIEPDFQDRRRRLGVSPVLAALTEEIQQAQCHQ